MMPMMSEKDKRLPIPKLVHFIWISSVPDERRLKYVKQCAAVNCDYTVWLWYDSQYLFGHNVKEMFREYRKRMIDRTTRVTPSLDLADPTSYLDVAASKYMATACLERPGKTGARRQAGVGKIDS